MQTTGEHFKFAWKALIDGVEEALFSDGDDVRGLGDVSLSLSVQTFDGDEWPSGYRDARSGRLLVTLTIDAQQTADLRADEVERVYGKRLRGLGVERIVIINLPESLDLESEGSP